MKNLTLIIGASLMTLGGIGAVGAQPNPVQGTPGSAFPYAAPHEIRIVNGVPCRTVLHPDGNRRVVVACAEPVLTGSINTAPGPAMMGAPMMPQSGAVSGTPSSPFPYAAPHEIRMVNGVPCRTVLHPDGNRRVVVACAQ